MTFTKEQLIARAETVLSNARTAADFHDSKPYHLMDIHLAEIALASLEAEPVGEVVLGECDDCGCYPDARVACIAADGQADWENFKDGTRLYTAPPAPVVPDTIPKLKDGQRFKYVKDGIRYSANYANGWNQCRAAMLQGAEPASPLYKLPDGFDFDRFNDVVWLEAVASNPQMHSLTTSTIAMVALELNRKLAAGNSPAIPDGWVACSERMPEAGDDMIVFTDDIVMSGISYSKKKGFYIQALEYDDDEPIDNVTHWMPLPAEPQHETKH